MVSHPDLQDQLITDMKKIVFMDGFNSVKDAETQSVDIFSTILPTDLAELIGRTEMSSDVVDNVVNIWNSTGKAVGKLDEYLLDEDRCTQDEREIIIEALFEFSNNG